MTESSKVDLLIKEGEGFAVEFKERFTSRISEDMVAFANSRGGTILLGVRDDQNAETSVLRICFTECLKSSELEQE